MVVGACRLELDHGGQGPTKQGSAFPFYTPRSSGRKARLAQRQDRTRSNYITRHLESPTQNMCLWLGLSMDPYSLAASTSHFRGTSGMQ